MFSKNAPSKQKSAIKPVADKVVVAKPQKAKKR